MSAPVVVFRTHSDVEAAIVRGLLDSHGLSAFLSSDTPRVIFPVSVGGLSEVRVSVPDAQADWARRLIEEFRRDALTPEIIPFPDDLGALELRLGHRFQDRRLLERALTHRSRAHEGGEASEGDNESLEFLGDAVIGLVVAELLYQEFPQSDEGQKSKIKASLVARASLASLAERLELGPAMRLGRGEEKTGGRRKQALLANTCEAVIAALYLDGGLPAVQRLIAGEMRSVLDRVRGPGLLTAMTGDYKSALQEWLQARGEDAPAYHVLGETGPDHRKRFEVQVRVGDRAIGHAEGHTKKEAEQRAAHAALTGYGVL